MRKLILGVALSVAMIGCANYTGDTDVYEGDYVNGDIISGDKVVCTDNNSTECYSPDYSTYTQSDGTVDDVADEPSGDYSETYTISECNANGYFWCSIEQKCLNIPADGGTCTR